jgi:AcrR family transcriptional regulator
MKTSKAQQEVTRVQIVRAAVALMIEQGYESVTMKDIARAAGIGDATIYKYFATKERLLLGYFDWVAAEAVRASRSAPGFADYPLQARLQRLTDAVLECLAPDRAFVDMARRILVKSPLLMLGDQLQAKAVLKQAVQEDLQHAVATWDIEPSDFLGLLSGLYVDYCFGVVVYWLNDTSEDGADTVRFVDQTLGILVAALKSGLPDKLVQLALFVLRSQLARVMSSGAMAGVMSMVAPVSSPDAQRAPAANAAQPAAPRARKRAKPAPRGDSRG